MAKNKTTENSVARPIQYLNPIFARFIPNTYKDEKTIAVGGNYGAVGSFIKKNWWVQFWPNLHTPDPHLQQYNVLEAVTWNRTANRSTNLIKFNVYGKPVEFTPADTASLKG